MHTRTVGAALLEHWLFANERSQQWLVTKLMELGVDCHQSTVSAWIRGKWPPSVKAAVAVRTITNVDVESWALVEQAPKRMRRSA